MIRLENVTKGFWVQGTYKVVIDNLSLTLPPRTSLALLGRNGAGKSTLMQMIAGTLAPDSGQIISDGSISWPVGFGASFHKDLSGAQNVRFVARIYGVDTQSLMDFVAEFAELGPHFNAPVRTYSAGMRARLAFGTSMGVKFDTYLVDEATSVGDARFKKKSQAVFRKRMQDSGAVMVSHNMAELRQFCDSGLVLENGKLHYFENLEDAIELHESILAL